MSSILKTPLCQAIWTRHITEVDKKFPHKSGSGYFSVTGSFPNGESRDELLHTIYASLGEKAKGTIHTKSDGTGRSEVKFKKLAWLNARDGSKVEQHVKLIDKDGNKFEGNLEHAQVHIYFRPSYFPAYKKTSLLLEAVQVMELAKADFTSNDEQDAELLKELDIVPQPWEKQVGNGSQ